jgi:hypothetical protein
MLSYDRELHALRTWLDSWPGIGHVAAGMHRQGFDLQLAQYDERGWRATFYTTGMVHSPTSATGTPWERTHSKRRKNGPNSPSFTIVDVRVGVSEEDENRVPVELGATDSSRRCSDKLISLTVEFEQMNLGHTVG